MGKKQRKFKRGDEIVYPRHGAGKVVEICDQLVGGVKQKYYRISFIDSPVVICIPLSKASELGLRFPLSRRNVINLLSRLGRRTKITNETLKQLDKIAKEKLDSGNLSEAIDLVNILRSLAKQKEEENKNFSYSYSDRLEVSMDFIRSEALLVLGRQMMDKYCSL